MPVKHEDDARFDHLSVRKSGFLDLGGKWEATQGRDQYSGDGRSALADAERQAEAPLTVADVLTITPEQSWRARWKAIAKYYRRLYQHPVTSFCPNCNANETRNAEHDAERQRLRSALAKQNHEIGQALGRALGYPKFADDQKNFPGATDADGVCVGEHVAETLASEAAAEIERLKGELAQLRILANAALGVCAQVVRLTGGGK